MQRRTQSGVTGGTPRANPKKYFAVRTTFGDITTHMRWADGVDAPPTPTLTLTPPPAATTAAAAAAASPDCAARIVTSDCESVRSAPKSVKMFHVLDRSVRA